MTIKAQIDEPESDIECSVCGMVGTPPPNCQMCRGTAATQSRAYTLTERRRADHQDDERYSRTGNVTPQVVNLPGSFTPTK